MKFKFSHDGIFGISFDKSSNGIPGYNDANGMVWFTSGNFYNRDKSRWEKNLGIGNLGDEKEVTMTYDGQSKKLKISCESEVAT